MLLFIVFAPLLTALLILIGAPARLTALLGAAATAVATLVDIFPLRSGAGGIPVRSRHFRSAKAGGFSSC